MDSGFTTAYQVYLPSLVTADGLVEGNAKLQGSASMAVIAGRSTAGLAADSLGPATAVLLNAGSFGTVPVLVVSGLVFEPFALLIPLTGAGPRVIFFVIGAAMVGAGSLIGNILAAAFRQAYCPPDMLGRAVAGMRFLAFGTIPLGATIAGGLGTAFGVRDAVWIVLTGSALAGTFLLRVPRHEPDVMSEASAVQSALRS